jgi:hypothetical protein
MPAMNAQTQVDEMPISYDARIVVGIVKTATPTTGVSKRNSLVEICRCDLTITRAEKPSKEKIVSKKKTAPKYWR